MWLNREQSICNHMRKFLSTMNFFCMVSLKPIATCFDDVWVFCLVATLYILLIGRGYMFNDVP